MFEKAESYPPHNSLKRDLLFASVLGALGAVAANISINIPHTEVVIEARWLFGYMAFVMIRRIGIVFCVATLLCLVGHHRVPLLVALFGNLMYAIPFGLILRWLHHRFLVRTRHPALYAAGWFSAVLIGYQIFTTPILWMLLAFFRDQPIPPAIWNGFQTQPFLEESIFVGLVSALCLTIFRVNETLRQSRTHLATVLNSIGDGVISTDETGRVDLMNPVAETLTGWPLTDCRGMFLTDIFRIDDAETGRPVENPVSHVLKTGEMVDLSNHTRLTARDGTQRQIADTAAPIRDYTGAVCGVVLVFRDVGQAYAAREALRQSEEKYRQLFNMESDAIFLIREADRVILEANAAAETLYGYRRDALVGKKIAEITAAPESTEALPTENTAALPVRYHIRQDGTIFPVEITHRRFTWKQTPVQIAAVRDVTARITEAKRRATLEAQLRQAHKMEAIGTLAGGIAHDFNNILAPIIGYAEIMLDDLPPDSKHRQRVQGTLQAAIRARGLVRQILTFSRKTDTQIRPIELKPLLKETLKLLRAMIPVSVNIQEKIQDTGQVAADPTQIQQVLINLCTNAAHAMREDGGRLTVSLEEYSPPETDIKIGGGDYVRLSVQDTGVGMDEETLQRIFEPYYTTKTHDEGTGLGLAVVHGIVRNHGGHIDVNSKPGEGTVFWVYLPITAQDPEPVEAPRETPGDAADERILLVDDEPQIIDMLGQMMRRLGYRVTSKNNGNSALSCFAKSPGDFDLVITDVTMPDIMGDRLLRKIRAIRSDIPVIAVTGHSERVNAENAKRQGFSAIMMKPVSKETLTRTVRRVLDEGAETLDR